MSWKGQMLNKLARSINHFEYKTLNTEHFGTDFKSPYRILKKDCLKEQLLITFRLR